MLSSFPVAVLVGTGLGFLSGLGIGGGSLLILWLTLMLNTDPDTAKAVNLLFFLPSALIACLFRWKKGSIHWKKILPAMVSGCVAAAACSRLGESWNMELLRTLFGVLLLLTGLREILYRPRKLR